MKWFFLACAATLIVPAGPAAALDNHCATCNIKTKQPSTRKPGKFDFEMACAFDITGEEMRFTIIASDEDEARQLAQTQAPADCW